MWIWQADNWPNFSYDQSLVLPSLEGSVQAVAPLRQLAGVLGQDQRLDWEAAILLDETLASAKIEGELYDRDSVRSSIVNKLGIGQGHKVDKQSDAMVELLLMVVRGADQSLGHDQIKHWHQMLFPVAPVLVPIAIGDYRNETMQIVSGRYGKQQVHFEAPAQTQAEVESQMTAFLNWFENNNHESAFIRAAIAKFWFVTIHPFDDGNGRLSRLIAEKCLAQAEQTNLRLFSLSSAIEAHRHEYYQILESHQRCSDDKSPLDLTQWIIWFLSMVELAALNAKREFERVMQSTYFWQQHQADSFNPRQLKLIKRLLETNDFSEGISRKKYKALVKTADASATRDIADLVDKQVLTPVGEGRSRKYLLKSAIHSS